MTSKSLQSRRRREGTKGLPLRILPTIHARRTERNIASSPSRSHPRLVPDAGSRTSQDRARAILRPGRWNHGLDANLVDAGRVGVLLVLWAGGKKPELRPTPARTRLPLQRVTREVVTLVHIIGRTRQTPTAGDQERDDLRQRHRAQKYGTRRILIDYDDRFPTSARARSSERRIEGRRSRGWSDGPRRSAQFASG
jgi:hypothetical protein